MKSRDGGRLITSEVNVGEVSSIVRSTESDITDTSDLIELGVLVKRGTLHENTFVSITLELIDKFLVLLSTLYTNLRNHILRVFLRNCNADNLGRSHLLKPPYSEFQNFFYADAHTGGHSRS